VSYLTQSNKQFNFAGIGQISKTSMNLYTGRYYDNVSGRTRTIPKPKTSLLNPYSHKSMIDYL
jgi:hypothetical protein